LHLKPIKLLSSNNTMPNIVILDACILSNQFS
jgi:hypothetical protein